MIGLFSVLTPPMKIVCHSCGQVVEMRFERPTTRTPGICSRCSGSMFAEQSVERLEKRQKEREEVLRWLKFGTALGSSDGRPSGGDLLSGDHQEKNSAS